MAHEWDLDGVGTVAATNGTLNIMAGCCCLLTQLMAVEGDVGNICTVGNCALRMHKMVAALSAAVISFRLNRETTLLDNAKEAGTDTWNQWSWWDLNSTQLRLVVGSTRRRRRIFVIFGPW